MLRAEPRAIFADLTFRKRFEALSFLYEVDLQMCFLPQRRASFVQRFHRRPPHPPLYGVYLSSIPEHKTAKNTAFSAIPISHAFTPLSGHLFFDDISAQGLLAATFQKPDM